MNKKKKHIVFLMANNSSVPYFLWFAEKAMNNPNYKFSFILLHNSRPIMIEEMKKLNCECYWIPFSSEKRKLSVLKAIPKLISIFRTIKADVVHTHLFDDSLPGLLAAKLAGVKKRIITKQDTAFHYFYARKWIFADKINNKNATHIIPVSEEAKKFVIEKENAPIKKITMIHHGIPPEIATKQLDEYKKELIEKYQLTGKKVIGTVARLIDWKGYQYIINSIPEVIKKYPNVIYLFVGQGSQKEELLELAKNLNVTQYIVFTGWLDKSYIPSLYSILDVYAHAANYEPFGFVIAEAMMNGAPVVSTPTGSALDAIIHKENGYIVNYKDAKSLADGIIYALENGLNFREKGKQTALQMYNFELMYNNYINLYSS